MSKSGKLKKRQGKLRMFPILKILQSSLFYISPSTTPNPMPAAAAEAAIADSCG